MMDLKKKRSLAKNLYVNTDATIKSISHQCETTEKTLRDWIRKFGWEKEKAAGTITTNKLLKESYLQLAAINKVVKDNHNGIPTKQLSDAKAVLLKEIETLSNYPLHQYIKVMDDYMVWLSKNEPKSILMIAKIMNRFIESLATQEGVI